MQNEPNLQPTPEQPAPTQPEEPASSQIEQPATASMRSPTPPAPVQSPTQPAPNAGQPADLSAQKLLDDYDKRKQKRNNVLINVIAIIFAAIGFLGFYNSSATLLQIFAEYDFKNSPDTTWVALQIFEAVASITVATASVFLGFRKEIGRRLAKIGSVLFLGLVAGNIIVYWQYFFFILAFSSSSGAALGIILLSIGSWGLRVAFFIWVFRFMGKQSVRNLFRP